MSLDNNPVPSQKLVTEPSPSIVAEVTVCTATAIVTSKYDPYRILVATSAKHKFPVLPGGKMETADLVADGDNPGLSCVLREIKEEIGTDLLNPKYIGKATDPDRDIRLVPPSKLTAAVVVPTLPSNLPDDGKVKAHYGCPDHLFVGQVDETALTTTEELRNLKFIDIRTLGLGDLSAGHDVVVLAYRDMLDRGGFSLPETALKNFALEGEYFARHFKVSQQ